MIKILFLAFLLFLNTGCHNTKEVQFRRSSPPVTFLIPAGFQGNLRIVYDEPCGMQPVVVDGRLVFEFQANGLLIIQKKSDVLDTKDAAYYFFDPAGNREKIEQVIDHQRLSTVDKKGERIYLDHGNTTLKEYIKSDPVVVIKGMGVKFLEVLNYVNGKLMNKGKVSAEYMEFGVYRPGLIDSTALVLSTETAGVVEEEVKACRRKKEGDSR